MNIIAIPLGWIMKGCYYVCRNYGLALLLFTLLTRLITFPLQIKQQKSSARMSMLQPELKKLQKKYAKNQQKLQEEQMNLYAKAGVNPMASCLPMIITMVILFALIPVIYGPLTYVSGIDKDKVNQSNALISNLHVMAAEVKGNDTTLEDLIAGYEEDGKDPYKQLEKLFKDEEKYPKTAKAVDSKTERTNLIEVIKLHNDIDIVVMNEKYFSQNLIEARPELMTFVFAQDMGGEYADVLGVVSEEIQDYAKDFNYDLFGIYMGTIPSWKKITCIIPILCFVLQLMVTVVSQYFQKKNNPDMAKAAGSSMIILYIMPLFSLWIGFSYPLGLGLYWCYSSLVALLQTVVLNKIYTPAHVAELVERDIAKEKASGKTNFMQKMAEAQMIQSGKDPNEVRKAVKEEMGEEYTEPKKRSKNELREDQRKKLNEARKRMAEKYGDEYDDSQDE